MTMKKIGIMGGTFDPIHNGHIMLGRQAYEEYDLDCIWYMPSRIPPHKKDHTITAAKDRLAMTAAAIAPYSYFKLSDFELRRTGGNTYTADTLRLLKEEYPDVEFFFIAGADSIMDIEKWYHPEYVLPAVTFLAAAREHEEADRSLDEQISYLTQKYQAHILRLHCREMDVASAEIPRGFPGRTRSRRSFPGAEGSLSIYRTARLVSGGKCVMDERITEIRKHLKKKLNPMRYEHTLGVSYTCMALAMRYSANLDQAEMAGLLHDCAKRYDDATIICKCQEHGIELTEGELRAPAVIHAKLGAWMAEHKYGITDPEVLSAIACHTTGKPAMSLLEKILYVADYIEPRRDKAPNLPKLRRLAFEDLDEALYQILDSTRNYLKETGTAEDDTTEQTWEYYHERHVHQ